MGRQVAYQPCPLSPTGPGGKAGKLLLGAAGALLAVPFVLFLALYAVRDCQLRDCQALLRNHSAETRAQIAALRERMEDTRGAAREEAGVLSRRLEAVNRTLAEAEKKWHAYQDQLNDLQENFTALEAREQLQKEEIKNLQQQLTEKSKQLNDEKRKSQEERMLHQAKIQQLREQGNSGWCFAVPSIPLLTILIAGSLSI